MSRQEAAIIYLDVLLGYRQVYRKYSKACEVLTETDKLLMQGAVVRMPNDKDKREAKGLFLSSN